MIEVKHLTKRNKEKTIIDDFSYTFLKNQVYVLEGKNGTGKSTLLKLITGIIKYDDGKIIVNGINTNDDIDGEARRDVVCYIDQSIDLIIHLSIYENLVLESKVLDYQVDEVELDRLLSLFRLNHLKEKKVKHLSGGQKRIVSFIKGLLSNKMILLYDEVLSSMDNKRKEIAIALLKENKKEKTIIITSNDELMIGTKVTLSEKSTTSVDEIIPYQKSVVNKAFVLRQKQVSKERILLYSLFVIFMSVFSLTMNMSFYNQGTHLYQTFLKEENKHVLINNSKLASLDSVELHNHSLYEIERTTLEINQSLKSYVIGYSNDLNDNEIYLIEAMVDDYGLAINDEFIINNKTYVIKDIYASLERITEPVIFFSNDAAFVDGVKLNQYASYQPSKEMFDYAYQNGIFSGIIFLGNDSIDLSINQMKVYQIGLYFVSLFLSVSVVILGYLSFSNTRSSLYRVLYVMSSMGVDDHTINQVHKKQLKVLLVFSYIIGLLVSFVFVYLMNQSFRNSNQLNLNLIGFSFVGFVLPLIFFVLMYVLLGYKKVQVRNLY
jgi:molybdate transport system ATP-binding protein/molybdate/tungstate transport system ATP-binding protein